MWDSLLFCAVRGVAAAAAVNSWPSWLWIPKLPSPLLSNPHFWALPNLFVFFHSSSISLVKNWLGPNTSFYEPGTWTFVSSGSGFIFEPFGLERLLVIFSKYRNKNHGDLELAAYLANEAGPVPLVLDLRIAHDRVGSSANPALNGTLTHPNNIDESLNKAAKK